MLFMLPDTFPLSLPGVGATGRSPLPARKGKDRQARCLRSQEKEGNRHQEPTPAFGHPSKEGSFFIPSLEGMGDQSVF